MNPDIESFVYQSTKADKIENKELIQTLWSGYGKIVRAKLQGSSLDTVILKNVIFPTQSQHPHGWNTNHSHMRKARSYQVEMAWYKNWSLRCNTHCRIPKRYDSTSIGDEHLMILEDLDAAGFPLRKSHLSKRDVHLCLKWLAHFHATFLGEKPEGLWEIGTYWHLDTRPDEWGAMEEGDLKQAARYIDELLNKCHYQTFVHGDAKVANFCFSANGKQVAALDFQYVGGGCGMKDVVYFLGSCLHEEECARWEDEFLDAYFSYLKEALLLRGNQVNWQDLETEWRSMYPIAWADFYRFLLGWMPNHYKVNDYSEQLAQQTLVQLKTQQKWVA